MADIEGADESQDGTRETSPLMVGMIAIAIPVALLAAAAASESTVVLVLAVLAMVCVGAGALTFIIRLAGQVPDESGDEGDAQHTH